ncbi:hypothetical protein B0H13DRAFT_2352289 [Mycena leptocephala]|nr:hypothetical protein B0H13DRAFT_2352289 [Mycena leptocephala]
MASALFGPGLALPFRFSTPVPPLEILASGTLTLLPARMHSMEDVASTANRDLKDEWTAALGKPPSGAAGGSPHGHVATAGVPECLAERMYMCAYIMDFMIWYDDLADADRDSVDKSKSISALRTLSAELKGGTNPTSTSPSPNTLQSLEHRMFHRLLALDQPATAALLHEWELFATYQAESFNSQRNFSPLMSTLSIGSMAPVFRYTTPSPPSASPACPHSCRAIPCCATYLLLGKSLRTHNDYYSWDKELAAHTAAGGHGRVYNCQCVTWIMESIAAFEKMWRDWEENGVKVKEEDEEKVHVGRVQRYVEAAMFATSGGAYWHARAPRYKVGE